MVLSKLKIILRRFFTTTRNLSIRKGIINAFAIEDFDYSSKVGGTSSRQSDENVDFKFLLKFSSELNKFSKLRQPVDILTEYFSSEMWINVIL
jgi:hypothetical protein